MTFDRVLGATVLVLVLGGFFVWVLVEMATASGSVWRLQKLAIGMGCAVVVAPLVYLALAPLRRRRGRSPRTLQQN